MSSKKYVVGQHWSTFLRGTIDEFFFYFKKFIFLLKCYFLNITL